MPEPVFDPNAYQPTQVGQTQTDAQGRKFVADPHSGKPVYLRPDQETNPDWGIHGTPGHENEDWDSRQGKWIPKPTDKLNKWIIGGTIAGLTAGVATAANAGAFSGIGGIGGGGGAAIPAATSGVLPSTTIGTGFIPGVGLASGTGAAAGGGYGASMGIGSKLLGYGKNLLKDKGTDLISKGLGNYSQAQANNRGTKAEILMDQNTALERELLAREQEKRVAQANAYSNMQIGNHAATWQPATRPAGITASYANPTQASRDAGSELFKQAMARMNQPDLQNPTAMPAYNNLSTNPDFLSTMKPGVAERLSGYGALIAPFLGKGK